MSFVFWGYHISCKWIGHDAVSGVCRDGIRGLDAKENEVCKTIVQGATLNELQVTINEIK
jgi:hypothetical protein